MLAIQLTISNALNTNLAARDTDISILLLKNSQLRQYCDALATLFASRFDDLLPVLNGLVVQGLRRKFGQLNAAHTRVGDVGEDRLRVTGVRIADHHTFLPEPGDSLCRV